MSDLKQNSLLALQDRIKAEIQDSFDEELEMEMDDDRLERILAELADRPERETVDRRIYFKELLALQPPTLGLSQPRVV